LSSLSPKLNQKIQFQVGCQDKVTKLSYYIVGRGNVLVSQVVDLAGTNIGVFEFEPTLAMAPSSSLVVYYVTESGEIISDETELSFEPETLANPVGSYIHLICLR
jgi:Alpha-2-macroglobulin bait region domain